MAKKKIQAEDIKQAAQGKWADLIFHALVLKFSGKRKRHAQLVAEVTVFAMTIKMAVVIITASNVDQVMALALLKNAPT